MKRTEHGLSNTRLYRIWGNMKSRCYCKTDPHYERWGAKGITICEEWESDFKAFYDWSIENGYSDELTIDRINNNKGYSPDNCRWATLYVQANNTSKNKFYEFNGETHTVSEWARIVGVKREIIKDRMMKLGWSFEESIQTPVLPKWNHRKGVKNFHIKEVAY